jgi:hypothetical protein
MKKIYTKPVLADRGSLVRTTANGGKVIVVSLGATG